MENAEFDIDEKILHVLNGIAEPWEKCFLDEWIHDSVKNEEYYKKKIHDFRKLKISVNITRSEEMKQQVGEILSQVVRNRKQINTLNRQKIKSERLGWRKVVRVAAVLIVVLGGGLVIREYSIKTSPEHILKQPLVYPGRSIATITLTNGEELEVGNRVQDIREGNGMYIKLDSTVVTYSGEQTDSLNIVYNTLNVPIGGEFRLILSDGTKVWVNAGSTLKYPVAFGQNQREVFLEGEAYFEVEKYEYRPFIVHTSRGNIEVLGTGFNVRDYQEEAQVVTTLVEGKVAYHASEQCETVILLPGYQLVDDGDKELESRKVDVEMYVGWKDGRYVFEDATLEEIMQVLSGWYGVTVFYKNEELKNLHFTGDLERYENINDFLHFMELGGKVVFNIQGKTMLIE